jgi:hypothetical protein
MGYIIRKTKDGKVEIEYAGEDVDKVIELAEKLGLTGFKEQSKEIMALKPKERDIEIAADRYELVEKEGDIPDGQKIEFLKKMPTSDIVAKKIVSNEGFKFDIGSLQEEFLGRTFFANKKRKNETDIYRRFYERVRRAKQKISTMYKGEWKTGWKYSSNATKYKVFWFEEKEEKEEEHLQDSQIEEQQDNNEQNI